MTFFSLENWKWKRFREKVNIEEVESINYLRTQMNSQIKPSHKTRWKNLIKSKLGVCKHSSLMRGFHVSTRRKTTLAIKFNRAMKCVEKCRLSEPFSAPTAVTGTTRLSGWVRRNERTRALNPHGGWGDWLLKTFTRPCSGMQPPHEQTTLNRDIMGLNGKWATSHVSNPDPRRNTRNKQKVGRKFVVLPLQCKKVVCFQKLSKPDNIEQTKLAFSNFQNRFTALWSGATWKEAKT